MQAMLQMMTNMQKTMATKEDVGNMHQNLQKQIKEEVSSAVDPVKDAIIEMYSLNATLPMYFGSRCDFIMMGKERINDYDTLNAKRPPRST